MSSALTYIVLGYANFFGSQPASNTLPIAPGPITGTLQGPFQLPEIRFNYTNTLQVRSHSVSSRKTTWNTARRTCQDEGGHLAIVNSVAEAETIGQLMNNSKIVYGWVGVHDFYQEDEFVTIHGEPLAQTGYDVWRVGDPNNWQGNENCVLVNSDGKLIDEICINRHNFICEFPKVQSFALPTLTQSGLTPTTEFVSPGVA